MTTGLVLSDVAVGYRDRVILSGVALPAIAPGSLVAVIGPNAVGKSTLMKAIAGLQPLRDGRVLVDGQDLAALSRAQRARLVGYLPQSLPQPTSLVAYESVLSACRAIRSDLPLATVEAMIDTVFMQLGLGELAFRRLNEMSGGQRQMVGLAQVIVRRPRLLLLDEPTSALDLRWQLNVLETVRAITERDGAICLMAMHDLNLALRFSDLVIVLGGGRVLTHGTPATAMSAATLKDAYGVEGRIERCSQGFPVVLIDRAAAR